MTERPIKIDVVSANDELIEVKLPTLDVPVKMTYDYFKSRAKRGYFAIRRQSVNNLPHAIRPLAQITN